MRKRMNLVEARNYYAQKQIQRVWFCSAEQANELDNNTMKFELSFDSLVVFPESELVFLRSGDNKLRFDGVTYLKTHTDGSGGEVVCIGCRDCVDRNIESEYYITVFCR